MESHVKGTLNARDLKLRRWYAVALLAEVRS